MSYPLSKITQLLTGSPIQIDPDWVITELSTDSRKLPYPKHTLFFALVSDRRDGHDFIPDAYAAGVRGFVVSREIDSHAYPGAVFIEVADALEALHVLAAYHRSKFQIPVIGVTGSNGKTIVKEWLYQLLSPDFSIVRSPRSYNSQIGVPLSVWRMNTSHTLAIFEAGISLPGEMEKLARIIRPTLGILTNIGAAHDEGFASRSQKENEKRKLFEGAKMPVPISVTERVLENGYTKLIAANGETIVIPFTDEASVQNALTCWSALRMMNYPAETIAARMHALQPVQMRLEIKQGIQQCLILNDAYSMDLDSLSIALDHLRQLGGNRSRTALLSDLPEGKEKDYEALIDLLKHHQVNRLITIGPQFQSFLKKRTGESIHIQSYPDRKTFELQFSAHSFHREAILLKGARRFEMEKLLSFLEAQVHQTRLEIDLGALRKNIRSYQSALRPGVKVMAMVKSFAYGSGGLEVARVMQEEGISYLGVAYADEGVALRTGGIWLPIMVMNTEPAAFDAIREYRLEPVLYSIDLLFAFQQYLNTQGEYDFPVHIELETGMHRLGIPKSDYDQLRDVFSHNPYLRICSVFSHLAAGEDAGSDPFSETQFTQLIEGAELIKSVCRHSPLVHLANSAAAIRKPAWQLDLVRIGIGLYGIDPAVSNKIHLSPVARLLATVAQIQNLQPGDSVSYNRRMVVDRATRIATLRLGYADGFPRRLGNGVGYVLLGGQKAPVLGSVCMDMFMVDITDIPFLQVGDTAIVFGPELPLTEVAKRAGTIPYEIMTGISQRVKRVYLEE
ncbi:MAG: alanine racemase [Bacteroidetes bacterium]|nr:alanine racemase [Bacteroidota bacterium]